MLQTLPKLDLREDTCLSHAIWASLEKIGAKQKKHEQLNQGGTHNMHLQISGDIDGEKFSETISCLISIGREYQRKTSVTPQLATLVAYILDKLNQNTREYLLRTIPEDFVANNQRLPEVDESVTADAETMLSRLRAAKQVTSRGAVRCVHSIDG